MGRMRLRGAGVEEEGWPLTADRLHAGMILPAADCLEMGSLSLANYRGKMGISLVAAECWEMGSVTLVVVQCLAVLLEVDRSHIPPSQRETVISDPSIVVHRTYLPVGGHHMLPLPVQAEGFYVRRLEIIWPHAAISHHAALIVIPSCRAHCAICW